MNKHGYLLLEFLLFCPVILLALAVMVFSFSASRSLLQSAEKKQGIYYALRSEMEYIRGVDFSALPAMDGRSFAAGAGRIRVRPLSPGLVEVSAALAGRKFYTLRSGPP